MNDDRCQHVPTAPGQSMCTCEDYRLWQRTVIEVQNEVIADLSRRLHGPGPARYLRDRAGVWQSVSGLSGAEARPRAGRPARDPST